MAQKKDEIGKPKPVVTSKKPETKPKKESLKANKPKTKEKAKSKKSKSQIIYPDGWAIVEVDEVKFLTFYKDDEPALQLELDEDVLKDIMEELNKNIVIDENMADAWTYRRPVNKTLPDFLTLMAKGKILATLPVDNKIGKKLLGQMEHYAEPVPLLKRLDKMRRRSLLRFILVSIVILIIIGALVYSGYQWAVEHYVEVGKQLLTPSS